MNARMIVALLSSSALLLSSGQWLGCANEDNNDNGTSTTTSSTTISSTTTTVDSSTTTTTEEVGVLHLKTFNEKFTCSQTGTPGPDFCSEQNEQDTLQFTSTGPDTYEVRDVPDTGFVYNGTLNGLVFAWTALAPGSYTEVGTWTFTADYKHFSGPSTYTAIDHTYFGQCNETGTEFPGTPPDPPDIGLCQ